MKVDKMQTRRAKENFDTQIKATWFKPEDPFEFQTLPYQRAVTSTHVNKIRKSLEMLEETPEGAHFTEPLVVNIRPSGKVALLDGYHRWEAMKKYNKPVKIKVEIYEGLSLEEEKSIYEDYNVGKSHTILDLVRPKIKKMKALKYLLENSAIPLTTYTNKKKGMSITSFIGCYKRALWESDKQRHGMSLINFIMESFNQNDAEKLVDWTKWYTSVAGEYHHRSDFYNTNFIAVCIYIYRSSMRPDVFEKRLANLKFDAYFKQILASSGGFSGYKLALDETRNRINKGLHRSII